MFRLLALAVSAAFCIFASCDDETPIIATTGEVVLDARATFDDAPVTFTTEVYDYSDDLGYDLRLTKFDFYASDVTLVGADGEEVELDELDLFEFGNANLTRRYTDIPSGEYTALKMSIGVPQDQNGDFCNTCATTDPLADASHWWQNWSSYIFAKIEGQLDSDGDGVTDDAGIVYHSGTDELFRTVTVPISLTVAEATPATIALDVDIKALFRIDGGMIDIGQVPATHTDNELANTKLVMDNFERAIGVR